MRRFLGGFFTMICAATSWASDQYIIVGESNLADYWTVDKGVTKAPKYPVAAVKAFASGCVAIGYTIQSDGTVDKPQVLRSFTNKKDGSALQQLLEQSALASTPTWHYLPATGNADRKPVYTYATQTFFLSGVRESDMKQHCDIPNFAEVVRNAMASSASSK